MKKFIAAFALGLMAVTPALAMGTKPVAQGNVDVPLEDFLALEKNYKTILGINKSEGYPAKVSDIQAMGLSIESARLAVDLKNPNDFATYKAEYNDNRDKVCLSLVGC